MKSEDGLHSAELRRIRRFDRFCFAVLCFCLLVILWGAWVRISHSGDGCGQSWPACQGKYLIDAKEQGKTWIEWIHRATSGLFGVAVILLVIGAFLKFPRFHPVRKCSLLILFFTISEALIGARLVLAGLTGSNTSLARVLTMNLHLLNSLLLTSSLFICWRLSLGKRFSFNRSLSIRRFFLSKFAFFFTSKNNNQKAGSLSNRPNDSDPFETSVAQTNVQPNRILFLKSEHLPVFVLVFFLIAFFGSLSSLASSLFPSTSLWKGLVLDFSSESSWLVRLRLLHPLLAVLFGGGFLYYVFQNYLLKEVSLPDRSHLLKTKWSLINKFFAFVSRVENVKKGMIQGESFGAGKWFILCLCLTLFSGLMNLLLLSPVFLKLIHLLMVYFMSMGCIWMMEGKNQ